MSDTVAVDGVHPVRMQLRHRRATRRAQTRQDPRRQSAPRIPGLHLQQGAAPRPLPEQPRPADVADAPAVRRQLRGNRLGHCDRRDRGRASSASPTPMAGTRSSTTAAAGRAITSAAPTAAHSSRRSAPTTDPMRWRRRRPARRGSMPTFTAAIRAASSSTPKCRCSSGRTRGCRRASRGRGPYSTTSPRIRCVR